jgi:DNA-binding winged helix-turn-helix (wHTH) protein/TolB-like protein/tetratricopeptide (TPR) repeat protein
MTNENNSATHDGRCRFGSFEFDLRTDELRNHGAVVKLAPQPSRVLALLLTRPGEVVRREELRDHLWGNETFVDFERGLNFCVLQVRTALGDSSDSPRFVQTVPRKGYRFIAAVEPVASADSPSRSAPTPVQAPEAPEVAAALAPKVPSARPALEAPAVWLIGAAIVLAPLLWLAWGTNRALPAAQTDRIRVAVLPFVNLTGDSGANYLADGLTDDVIAQLGRLGGKRLAVVARTSAMAYRDTTKTIGQIGRELNAAYVVESSLRRDGDTLRIGSSLVPTGDDAPAAVWSETFSDANGVESGGLSNTAVRLARLIAIELLPGARADELPERTSNPAAWHALMLGLSSMNRGTPDDVRRAIQHFESATTLHPQFASAWASLTAARHLLVMMGAVSPLDAYPLGQQEARRALAADPALPDAHLAQGLVDLWYERRPIEAAASFERALSLNASHAAALHDYAWSLVALNRDDEAIARIVAARDLDPLSLRANNDIGWLYLQLRQPADAIRACHHTLAIFPESLEAQACLERAYVQRGMSQSALRAALITMPQGEAGRTAPATIEAVWRLRLERLEALARTRWVSPYTLATHFAMVGQRERALDHLEAAADQRIGMLLFVERDPALDSLRQEPRFQALRARITEAAP